MKRSVSVLVLILSAYIASGQNSIYPIREVILKVDTLEFTSGQNTLEINNKRKILFEYDQPNEVMEVDLVVDPIADFSDISLVSSGDFAILDSVRFYTSSVASFKVRFRNLNNTEFLKFIFQVEEKDTTRLITVPLEPYTHTYVQLYPENEELYIGEEKVFELVTNNISNIIVDSRWTKGKAINYRFTQEGNSLRLHLLPTQLGRQKLYAEIQVRQPDFDGENLTYNLQPIEAEFYIREGRLVYLQMDQQEVSLPEDRKEAIDVQIENHRFLQLGKTYRIENQEKPGGALIAELFTKTRLNNDKVLSTLRVYALHRKTEGYLFIKDGDKAQFVTNVDITPKTNINKISIQRNGNDWRSGNEVYPGETVMVRLEGEGLHKGNFTFQGIENLELDSLVKNESVQEYKVTIPKDVSTRYIEIYNNNETTGQRLIVKEFQRPREFDFITMELSGKAFNVNSIAKPVFYEENLSDLVLSFNENMIDQEQLYGKQYLTIDVKISNKQGSLIEIYKFEDVVICPGIKSPRNIYYEDKDCSSENINLNNFINKKTYDLEEWSKVELEISHNKEKYGGEGEKKRIQIYLKRDYNFDIDVSFPAGLLILKSSDGEDDNGFTNFGGPSFAMIAQFSFYQPGKIAKYRPYKLGVGFIAIDAFNFTNSDLGDIGLVALGSLYPTSSDRKLTFPLFAGFGYLLKEGKPFFLVGPGIRVRL